MIISSKDTARFWVKVKQGTANECWPWIAYTLPEGYGRFSLAGKPTYAHRVAYAITNGDIPDGLVVRHTCDNPSCCNPAHLLCGTHQDNMDDRTARNRRATGERNGCSKLTTEDIHTIRTSSEPQKVLAARFGVSRAHISKIQCHNKWGHIQ